MRLFGKKKECDLEWFRVVFENSMINSGKILELAASDDQFCFGRVMRRARRIAEGRLSDKIIRRLVIEQMEKRGLSKIALFCIEVEDDISETPDKIEGAICFCTHNKGALQWRAFLEGWRKVRYLGYKEIGPVTDGVSDWYEQYHYAIFESPVSP